MAKKVKEPKMTKLDKILENNGCCLDHQGFMRFGKAGQDDLCDKAVVGLTVGEENERLVYDYDRLVTLHAREFAKHPDNKGRDKDEVWTSAAEYVNYNLVRSLPYMTDEEHNLLPPIMIRKLYR